MMTMMMGYHGLLYNFCGWAGREMEFAGLTIQFVIVILRGLWVLRMSTVNQANVHVEIDFDVHVMLLSTR